MKIEIRKANLTDTEQVFVLVKKFTTSFTPEREAFGHSFLKLLDDDSVHFNVSVYEDEIVAYCLAFDHYALYANGRVTWVEEIMVREDLRGRGIGRKHMKAVEEWALLRKSKLVGLATRRAASFYTAMGYEESATFFRKMISGV